MASNDWQRLREEALEPLLSGRAAMYRAFDEAPDVYRDNLTVVRPAAVVVLEGVSAASPALEDLVDRVVLVQTSEAERLSRLRRLIPADAWDDEWLAAEQRYFASFQDAAVDLLVTGEAH